MKVGRVCGIVEQQKRDLVLPASFGTEVFDSEALCLGLKREDVDADGRILLVGLAMRIGLKATVETLVEHSASAAAWNGPMEGHL